MKFTLTGSSESSLRKTHARGEFSSFVPCPARPYLVLVKKDRERSKALARLIAAGAQALKKLFVRAFALRGPSADSVQKQVAHHA